VVSSAQRTCVINRAHQLYCSGYNGDPVGVLGVGSIAFATGTLTQVGTAANWKTVSTGARGSHTCTINYAGALWCWGTDSAGQIGDGDNTFKSSPVQVGSGENWTTVSAGQAHTCAINEGGQLFCWGDHSWGQLGLGFLGSDVLTPAQVTSPSETWSSVSAGSVNTCALTSGKALYCWGADVASGTGTQKLTPTQITGTFTHVSVGVSYACAVRSPGELDCWGGGGSSTPAPVPGATNWSMTAVSGPPTTPDHICGIDQDGKLYCWGSNDSGQLGDNSMTDHAAPTQVGTDMDWASVTADVASTCAVKIGGTVHCWGENGYGQLALGSVGHKNTPTRLGSDTDWTRAVTDGQVSCAVKGGALLCTGLNTFHELPVYSFLTSFTEVGASIGSTNWTDVDLRLGLDPATSSWRAHGCAVHGGALFCWGMGDDGMLGDGDTSAHVVATPTQETTLATNWAKVVTGGMHTCASTTAGGLYCWGQNAGGQVGDGSTTNRGAPTVVPQRASSTWKDVGVGDEHTCAISENGSAERTIWCWGRNERYQLGNGSTFDSSIPVQVGSATNWSKLAVGPKFACAVDATHALYCWGAGTGNATGPSTADKHTPTAIVTPADPWQDVFASGSNTTYAYAGVDLYRTGQYPAPALAGGTGTDIGFAPLLAAPGFVTIDDADLYGVGMAITGGGALFRWGFNYYGQLGDGTGLYLTPQPVTVP